MVHWSGTKYNEKIYWKLAAKLGLYGISCLDWSLYNMIIKAAISTVTATILSITALEVSRL